MANGTCPHEADIRIAKKGKIWCRWLGKNVKVKKSACKEHCLRKRIIFQTKQKKDTKKW